MVKITEGEYALFSSMASARRKELQKDIQNTEHLNISGKFESDMILLGNLQSKIFSLVEPNNK